MYLTPLLGSAVLGASLVLTGPVAATPQTGADAVRTWNENAVSSLVAAAVAPPEAPLYLAYVHRAVYDAVRAARDTRGEANVPAAVATAAYTVLSEHFPAQAATLDAEYAAALAAMPDDEERAAGVNLGRTAADRTIADRADDGRNGPTVPAPSPGPGVWSPPPPNTAGISSFLGNVRPFSYASPSQFRPGPPPSLHSRRWARAYNETRILGSSTSESLPGGAERAAVARFWSDPPAVQSQRGLRAYSERRGLGALRTARLFALTNTASIDALITCFDAKYRYELWRPATAIPLGNTDRNRRTPGDAGWKTLLPATPNHPEYPSAHSCSTTAIAMVVAALDHGRLDLDLTSTTTGAQRHYSSVRQLTTEVANARIWGGLHWRFSTDAGERIGRAVARTVLASDADVSGCRSAG
jgi:hypothetical protein